MRNLGVIPARYHSTRLAGKVLLPIGGKPLVQHVYEKACQAKRLEEVWIATDDERVREAAKRFNAKCLMTAASHRSGTDRIAEVVSEVEVERIVNLQADEPLLEPRMIDTLLEGMEKDSSIQMATLCHAILDERDLANPNVVKVVRDLEGNALYFSRHPVPYVRSFDAAQDGSKGGERPSTTLRAVPSEIEGRSRTTFDSPRDPWQKHIGLYAYTKSFLSTWKRLSPTPLEQLEGLEQLRVLEHGIRIRVFDSPYETLGVDTMEDLERVRRILEKTENERMRE